MNKERIREQEGFLWKIANAIGLPSKFRLPRHPELGQFDIAYLAMANFTAPDPHLPGPKGEICLVLHARQVKGEQEFFLRVIFNHETGELAIGADNEVINPLRSITEQIDAQLSGAPFKSNGLPEGKWRIVCAADSNVVMC